MPSLFRRSRKVRRRPYVRRWFREVLEVLEPRNLLAVDFTYDHSSALTGLDATFAYDATSVRLVDNASGTVLRSLPVNDFTGVVRILGANLYADVIQISPPANLSASYFTSITIDGQGGSDQISVVQSVTVPGADVQLTGELLSMAAGVSISTSSSAGNSGDISLTGVNVSLGVGSALRAEAAPGLTAGDISITASLAPLPLASLASNFVSPVLVTNNQVAVQLNNAQVSGGNVTISASAATDTRFDELGDYADNIARDMFDAMSSVTDLAFSLISPISGQVKIQKASSRIVLDNATITASGAVSIDATATADASFNAVGINSALAPVPIVAVVGYGQTETKANIQVAGSTAITAVGDVSINAHVEALNDLATRGMGNARISNSDNVDVAVSVALAFNDFESTITTAPASVIQSTGGGLSIHASGDNQISSKADSILFQDGIAGIALSVAVDRGTVISTIDGTLIANNPQGSTSYSFDAGQVVNVNEDSITLSDIPEDSALERGDKLIYRADVSSIGGLVDGEEYLIADVENVPAGNDFTGVQKIRLARAMPLDIGNEAILPNSIQSLGKISTSTFPSSAAGRDDDNNLAITLPGIANGTRLTYLGPNSPVSENNIEATFARSAAGDTITRTDGRTGWRAMGLFVNQQIQLVEAGSVNSRSFTIARFSPDDRTLTLRETNVVQAGNFTGFALKTTPSTPTGIGNLTQGTEYTAAVVGGRVLLRNPANPANFIKFNGSGSGVQGFKYLSSTQTFSPATAVNPDRDTLFLANHGFQTGDLLVYRTDPTRSAQHNVYNFNSSTPASPTLIGTALLPDMPIDGMENGQYYFVTRVDANRIRLSENPVAARKAAYVELTGSPTGTHSFALPDKVVGIEILASLATENRTEAGAELSDDQQPWADVIFNSINRPENLFLGLVNLMPFSQQLREKANAKKVAEDTKNPLDENNPDTGIPLEFAGCFAVNVFHHTVQTRIGSTARIFSAKDLLIQSTIEEKYSSAVSSETTRNGLDGADASDVTSRREDVEISVAFSLVLGTNHSHSIVADGAQINALGTTTIDSQLVYPLLIDDANAIINPGKAVKESGLDGLQFLLDGTLGLSSLFNTSVAAIGGDPGSNRADIFVLGAAFNLAFFNNRSLSSIGAGALINQNPAWQSNDQSLIVNATTHMETVDVDQNAVFNLSISNLAEIGGDVLRESRAAPPGGTDVNEDNKRVQQSKSGQIKSTLRSFINPFGISGQNAIGPSVIVTTSTNATVAEIKDGARIRTGEQGDGVTVASKQDILSVAIAQTGATASEFGLTLSATVDSHISQTLASIGNNVVIIAPGLTIAADDNVERYAIDGSYVFGEKIGIGIAVGLNFQQRTTLAYLGAPTPSSDATTGPATMVIDGRTEITAHQGGNAFIFGLAGALLNDPDFVPAPEQPPLKPPPDPIASVTIAVGASIAFNKATNRVEAFIDDPSLATESLKLSAISDYEMRSIVIGGAVGTRKADTSFGIGGAFGINQVDNTTRAFVRDADITASSSLSEFTTPTGVLISARDNTSILADGGGVAVMIGRGLRTSNNIAIGVGFSINDLRGATEAFTEDTSIQSLGGGVLTQAVFDATIVAVSIGGAGAVSTNGSGDALNLTGAGAGSKNAINGVNQARYINSNIVAGSPLGPAPVNHFIGLEAIDLSNIQADAGAFSLALALSSIRQSYNLSVALGVGLNEINRINTARVNAGSNLTASSLNVLARSLSYIDALTIGGSLSAGANNGAFSGAGSGNKLTLATQALVDSTPQATTNLTLPGRFSVQALHQPTIVADAGGFAIALGKSSQNGVSGTLSIGIGAAENTITSNVSALVVGAQLLARAGNILVLASASPSISALTMGGVGAASISNGTAFTIAGAGAGSRNAITSMVDARISSTAPGVYRSNGQVSILADDNSAIVANSGALALLFTLPANTNINASVGVSLAINSISAAVNATLDRVLIQAAGNIIVSATSQGSISALTVAGTAAVALATGSSSSGITFSGAGTGSGNNITSQTSALVEPTSRIGSSDGRIDISATNSSTIDAQALAGSVAVSTSSGASVGLGVAIADNQITRNVRASIRDAFALANTGLSVTSQATAVIRALTVGVAASVALNNGQGSFSLAASGAGAQSKNSILGSIESGINSGAIVETLNGDLRVQSLDTSSIFGDAGGGTFAASVSSEGGSLAFSISAGIAINTIEQSILAIIEDANTRVTAFGKVDVIASSQSTIDSKAASVALSVAIVNPEDGFALGLAGAGANASNSISNTIEASILDQARVNARGTLTVRALDNATVLAIVPVVTVSFALGAGASISVTLATNTISNIVDARITDAVVSSTVGNIIIEAQATSNSEAFATPLAASISVGAAAGGSDAKTLIGGRTKAELGVRSSATATSGEVRVSAVTTATARAESKGGSAAAVNINAMLASAVIDTSTLAQLDKDANVTARNLNVVTYGLDINDPGRSSRTANAIVRVGGIGFAGGSGGRAEAKVTGQVSALINSNSMITVSGATLVDAQSSTIANADAQGGGGGALQIAALLADATITGSTSASIASNVLLSSGTLDVRAGSIKDTDAKLLVAVISIAGGNGGKATAIDASNTFTSIGASPAGTNVASLQITGAMQLSSSSTESVTADARGGGGGILQIGGYVAEATSSGSTLAQILDQARIDAGSLLVQANAAGREVVADLLTAQVALSNLGVISATTKITGDVTASIGNNTTITTPSGGSVDVLANGVATISSKADGGGGGITSIAVLSSRSTIGTSSDSVSTTATVGNNARLKVGSLNVRAHNQTNNVGRLLSVGVGGIASASATADALTYSDAVARIGVSTQVDAASSVAVEATSSQFGSSDLRTGSGSVTLSLAIAAATTRVEGQTRAHIDEGAHIQAGLDVQVLSTVEGAGAVTNLVAGVFGAVAVGSTKAQAINVPNVFATVDDAAIVAAGGSVQVIAVGRGEVDIKTESSGGSAIQVGVAYGEATFTPTVRATTSITSSVSADANVTVRSNLIRSSSTNVPSDRIEDRDDDADNVAINLASDTIDFAFPLANGTTVLYDSPANQPTIGGLVDGRAYNVLNVTPGQTIQLGNAFNASANVDTLRDIITFSVPHNFKPGDAVRLSPNGNPSIVENWQTTLPPDDLNYVNPASVLYVKGIFANASDPKTLDLYSIRLARTRELALASDAALSKNIPSDQVDAVTDRINLPNHALSGGQAVTYRASAVSNFATESVDVRVVRTFYRDDRGIGIPTWDVERSLGGAAIHYESNNNIFLPGHGFLSGDAVTYRAEGPTIGGLVNGATYYVYVINGNEIQLARSYHEAVGLEFDDRGTPDPADDILAIPRTPIAISSAGPQGSLHSLSRNIKNLVHGQTYYVITTSNNDIQLAVTRGGAPLQLDTLDTINILRRDGAVAQTITPVTRRGTHRLGTLGIDLIARSGTQSLLWDLTSQPTTNTHRFLSADGDPLSSLISVTGDGVSLVNAFGGSGGGIDVGVPTALLKVTPTVITEVGSLAAALGSIEVAAVSSFKATTSADTNSGGVASIGEAHADTLVNSGPVIARVQRGSSLSAGQNIQVFSDSTHSVSAKAMSKGGGLIGGRVAETTARLVSNTASIIERSAQLKAAGLIKVNSEVDVQGVTYTDTYAVGVGAGADSDNTNGDRGVTIVAPANVMVDQDAQLSAAAVDIKANIAVVNVDSTAKAISFTPILLGVTTAYADAYANINAPARVDIRSSSGRSSGGTVIRGEQGVDIQAINGPVNVNRYAEVLAVGLIPPQAARRLGETSVGGLISGEPSALVVAGPRTGAHGLTVRNNTPLMALYTNATAATVWHSDIRLISPALELILDSDGNPISQKGIGYRRTANTIVLEDVTNVGPGQVLFEGNMVTGERATLILDNASPSINIVTAFGDLFVNKIRPLAVGIAGVEPKVTIANLVNLWEFDVRYDFSPTIVNIANTETREDDFNIRLQGLIDNPLGTTTVHSSKDVASASFDGRQGVIRTNRLLATARSFGLTAVDELDRIPIDIVEAEGYPALIDIQASSDIYIGLQGLNRNANVTEFTTLLDGRSIFSAGNDADIMLLGGINQQTSAGAAQPGIIVHETADVIIPPEVRNTVTTPITTPRNTRVTDHFRVSRGTAANPPLVVTGSGSDLIPTTFDLGTVRAGNNIDIYKAAAVTQTVNILSDTNILNNVGGNNLNATTNGSIDLTEVIGDLRVGRIVSSHNTVDLLARSGSILEIPDNGDVAGDNAIDIGGVNIFLAAPVGGIGNANKRLDLDSSIVGTGRVFASALNSVYLSESVGNLNVDIIRSLAMDVDIVVISGDLVDIQNDPAADLVGNTISLALLLNNGAQRGNIGSSTNAVEINSSVRSEGGLRAQTAGNMHLVEVAEALYVLSLSGLPNALPDVFLTVLEDATNLNDMVFRNSASVASATLVAGDDFELADGLVLSATGNVSISIDPPATDKDPFGGTLALQGRLIAATASLTGGDDIDLFQVASATTPAILEVFGGQPAFPVYPGDKLLVAPRGAFVRNNPSSIPLGEGTVTAQGRSTIDYHSIEMVDIEDVNDPPVNLLPPAQRTDAQSIILSLDNGNGLLVQDPDAGNATNFSVELSVPLGSLAVTSTPGVTITGNNTGSITLVGGLASINTLLIQGVVFSVPVGFSGTVNLTVLSNDRGNSGGGGPLTDVDNLAITIGTDFNEPPVNRYFRGLTFNTPQVVLSAPNNNGMSVRDNDAGQANNFVFSLSTDQGQLGWINTFDLSVTGSGTQPDPYVLTGMLEKINAALAAGVSLIMPDNFAGKVRFTMVSNDAGNTGVGGPLTDTDTFIVSFVDPNIAPVNSLPPDIVTDSRSIELNWRSGNQISVADGDAGDADDFSVTLTVGSGLLLIRQDTMARYPNVIIIGNRSGAISLEGRLADINGLLNDGLQYVATSGFLGTTTLTIVSNDAGNTGSPGPLTDTDVLQIRLEPDANDPPVNLLPPTITTNATTVVLSEATGNNFSVTDPDAGNAVNFEVTLVAATGTLELLNPNAVTWQGNGTTAAPLKLIGSLSSINFALAFGLQVNMPAGFLGTNTIEILSNDAGNRGPGGPLTDRDQFTIHVVAGEVNDPPVNQLPADFTSDQVFTLSAANGNALSVSDPDAGNATDFQVALNVDVGFLTLANSGFVRVIGSGSPRSVLTLTGTLANINRTLEAGVTYWRGNIPLAGQVLRLTMTSNDAGNSGAGGPLSDTDTLLITLVPPATPVNDPPVNVLPLNFATDRTRIELSQATGRQLSVSDSDAGSARNFSVTLSAANVAFQVLVPGVRISFGNVGGSNTLRLEGTVAQINQTLSDGLVLETGPGFNGQLNLTMVSNDAGNTGSGGPLTDTDILVINVLAAVNDPPINQLPDSFNTDRTTVVFSAANGNAISVADVDAGNATNFRVEISSSVGGLSLPVFANVIVSGVGSEASPLILVGSLPLINAALAAGLVLSVPSDFAGTVTLSVLSNDAGNTGVGGPLTDLDSLRVLIATDLNDAPINALPAPITTDAASIVLSSALGNALSVADSDAGDADNFNVQLMIGTGALSLVTDSGVTVAGTGAEASPLSLTGSLSRINAVLAGGLRVQLPIGFVGNTSLRIISHDAGNTGIGGPLSDDDRLSITVIPGINDGPVNILPPPVVSDQTTIVLSQSQGNALSVVDVDAGNAANFSVSLSVPVGTLSLVNGLGLFVSGNGTLASPLQLIGTLSTINTALSRGLTIALPANFTGTTALVMLSNDNGNTGSGGPRTDLDLLSLTVQADVNDPPINHLPDSVDIPAAPYVFSLANGNALSVSDVDAGLANNFSVQLSIDQALLSLIDLNPAGVTLTGDGSLAQPLRLTGALPDINAALASGVSITPLVQVFGKLSLEVRSHDAGNTGSGGPLSDIDFLLINVLPPENVAPYVVSVTADSTSWVNDFRDFVDGEFGDRLAAGYRVPNGAAQLVSLPWVNVDRLKITFSEDVGPSLDFNDFGWRSAPGFTALAGTSTVLPKIIGWSYDAATFTVTLQLGGAVPAAVFDLTVSAAGVTDVQATNLDGEWVNGQTIARSGDNTAGGDFNFRLFFLPGDTLDESRGNGTRTVNTNDSQEVRDRQNGFVVAGVGAVGYDPRADLDGSGFINTNDSQLVRDRQAGIIFRPANVNIARNPVVPSDVNDDQSATPLDALLIINSINAGSAGMPDDPDNPLFLDVSGDGFVTPLDVLLVINQLNESAGGSGGGEGEAMAIESPLAHDQALLDVLDLPTKPGEVGDAIGLDFNWGSFDIDFYSEQVAQKHRIKARTELRKSSR